MKKLLALILSAVMLLTLVACGGDTSAPAGESTVSDTPAETEAPAEAKKAEPVAVGNTITVPFAEITIAEATVKADIKQSVKTGNITRTTGPSPTTDKKFVYIRGTIKNTGKSEISMADVGGVVDVDGYKYNIDDFGMIKSDGSSSYSLEPLMTYTYTAYAAIPNELADSFKSCVMTFGFEENFANVVSFSEEEFSAPYMYTINITK